MLEKNNLLFPSIIVSAAILAVGILLATTWRNNSKANETITVTGSAKMDIVSDLGILRGTISSSAFTAQDAFRLLIQQKPALEKFLGEKGFKKEEVVYQTMNNYPTYEYNAQGYSTNRILSYNYSQRFEIRSKDVQLIQKISLELTALIEKGVNVVVDPPEYHYTNLAKIKIEIQAEAAKDAMIRAEKIAAATGGSLGAMRNARMGVLQITPKFSTMISDYGMNDVSSIEKEITSVVNASFEID